MSNIIKHREMVTVTSYRLQYDYEGKDNHGFSFECNEQGHVDPYALHPSGRANYEACLSGSVKGSKVVNRGVEKLEHFYFEPAECRCSCGSVVVLHSSWANDCHCGREFNGSGQELADRSQWGEETGERF